MRRIATSVREAVYGSINFGSLQTQGAAALRGGRILNHPNLLSTSRREPLSRLLRPEHEICRPSTPCGTVLRHRLLKSFRRLSHGSRRCPVVWPESPTAFFHLG